MNSPTSTGHGWKTWIITFFEPARLNITITDRFGNPIVPREWFLVPAVRHRRRYLEDWLARDSQIPVQPSVSICGVTADDMMMHSQLSLQFRECAWE